MKNPNPSPQLVLTHPEPRPRKVRAFEVPPPVELVELRRRLLGEVL